MPDVSANGAPIEGIPAAAPAAPATGAPTAPAAEGSTAAQTAPAGDDWATRRTAIAGADEKLAKRLSRYGSEKDVVDALIAAQNKIASGALKEALPANATPEQKAEWRKENGIPAEAKGYEYKAPTGIDLTDLDKEAIGKFTQAAHDSDMTPAQVQKAIDWHYANLTTEMEAMQADDLAQRKQSEDELRKDWGSEYRLNVNLITGMLDSAPAGVKEQLLGARLADGTVLGDNPATMRWFASMARELNPTATVVPGSGGNASQAIEAELAGLTKMMGDRKSDYWKGAMADKNQARYRELIDVQNKLKK